MKISHLPTAILAYCIFAFNTHASTIISPIAATATSEFNSNVDIGNTIDQSGLSSGFISGEVDFDTYLATNPSHTLFSTDNEWFSEAGVTFATINYDLGSVYSIDSLALWNEDGAGIGSLDISVSLDNISFQSVASNLMPVDNPNGAYGAEIFSFTANAARYVRFFVSSCPQPDGTSLQYCGIGEVAFSATPVYISVLNIDARINAAPTAGHTPLRIGLPAGHHQATLVNPSIDSGASFTAWNPWPGNVAGWRTDFVISPVAESGTGGGDVPNAPTAQEAFDLTVNSIANFYLTSDQSVDFYVQDAIISDNQGGVSLRISPVWGDINDDGNVNIVDVLLATQAVLGTTLSNEQLTRGNVAPLTNGIPQPIDHLEALDAADIFLITQKALGIKIF